PELAGAVHDGMIRKRRIVRGAYAGVGPDRFGAYPENVALTREELGRLLSKPRIVRHAILPHIEELLGIVRARRPARAHQHPRAGRNPPVLRLPRLDGGARHDEVWIVRYLVGHIDDHGGADEPRRL